MTDRSPAFPDNSLPPESNRASLQLGPFLYKHHKHIGTLALISAGAAGMALLLGGLLRNEPIPDGLAVLTALASGLIGSTAAALIFRSTAAADQANPMTSPQYTGSESLAKTPTSGSADKRKTERTQGGKLHQGTGGLSAPTSLEAELMLRTAELIEANEALQQKIIEKELAENQLRYDVFHDRLTSLPNRSLFSDRLTHSIKRSRRRGEAGFAVLVFNIDRFKDVNDTLGLSAGDELLLKVSRRISEALRPGDTLARLGGDDFAILVEKVAEPADASACAHRILALLESPIEVQGREIFCSGSIGIAGNRLEYTHAESLLQDANHALDAAKSKNRPGFEFFAPDMRSDDIPRLEIETDLRRAVAGGREFVLHYQPIIAQDEGSLAGFEALVRWQHPTRGLLGPDKFIAVAETSGLIVQIGRWVLEEACSQLHRWQAEGVFDTQLFMSVNISSRQLTDEDLIDDVARCTRDHGLSPGSLKLEITESLLMDDPESAARILKALKDLEIQLSIDDFGTGYSSLSYLHKFPFDYLKIDQSFVGQMTKDPEIREIVRTIISLAHGLHMDVIAEGVEDSHTAKSLLEQGCRLVQGYHYSPPIPAHEVKGFSPTQALSAL